MSTQAGFTDIQVRRIRVYYDSIRSYLRHRMEHAERVIIVKDKDEKLKAFHEWRAIVEIPNTPQTNE